MPLFQKQFVDHDTWLGIWDINESAEWFRSQLQLNKSEILILDSIRNPGRKLHWLSSRVLIRTLLGTNEFVHLENDLKGKPVIHNFPYHLSISHSGNCSVLVISKQLEVGVDIEKISPKIELVAHKFLTEAEAASIDKAHRREHLYIFWCAKEAMYKFYGKKQLNFKNHIFVTPFKYQSAGVLSGKIQKEDYYKEVTIHYKKISNYMLAYTYN